MKDKITQISSSLKRHRTLVENFGYLSVLQAFTILLPLLTIPYLMRVLGVEQYGLVVYAQAIIQYFVIIVNFGFNISATKDVSIHRDNPSKLSEIVSSVLIVKVLLFIVSFAILLGTVFSIPVLREHFWLYVFCMGLCLGEVVFPVWFFQGIEKMRYITIINVVSRTIFAACIFILVKQPEHYLLVPVFNGLGALIGGCIALWVVFRKEKVRFALQKWSVMWCYVKDSAPLFFTRVSVQFYLRTNVVIVGAFLGMKEVAYYEVAYKIVQALKLPFQTFGLVLFPKASKEQNITFLHRALRLVLALSVVTILLFVVLSPFVFRIMTGEEVQRGVDILRILLFSIFPVVVSNFLGEQLLIPFGFKREYMNGAVFTSICYFLMLIGLYFSDAISLYNIAFMVVATETIIATYDYFMCRKKKLI